MKLSLSNLKKKQSKKIEEKKNIHSINVCLYKSGKKMLFICHQGYIVSSGDETNKFENFSEPSEWKENNPCHKHPIHLYWW